jgi:cysteine desulfurase family protein (TIGR01976 family)
MSRNPASPSAASRRTPKGWEVDSIRGQFPALSRGQEGRPVVYFDGPAGSQTPEVVADAVREYMLRTNANTHGVFATSRESDAVLGEAHRAVADLFGAADPDEIVFGANMTTLNFALSRALAPTWKRGDEIVVTDLDHDANVAPWLLAARDVGAIVRRARLNAADATLDLASLRAAVNARTRLVACTCCSNAVGSLVPVRAVAEIAHAVGALVVLDAVHLAPHASVDVHDFGCDFLLASAYKFFGPHVGILWGKRERLEAIPVYKVRPASDESPGRWMTGTQNHEGLAGVRAAVYYVAGLGRSVEPSALSRRAALAAAYRAIQSHEQFLVGRLLEGLAGLPQVCVWGVADTARLAERAPTVAFTHRTRTPLAVAEHLARRGIFAWHGNFYALALTTALGLEPTGLVRLGLLHYNTEEEVDRTLAALAELPH